MCTKIHTYMHYTKNSYLISAIRSTYTLICLHARYVHVKVIYEALPSYVHVYMYPTLLDTDLYGLL